MALKGSRTFVGFGLGPIQGGLFLYEAMQGGGFGRLVVAEVLPEMVASIRQSDGMFSVNIAHADRREAAEVGPVEIFNPSLEEDCRDLVTAVAEAAEIAIAVPSVQFYETQSPGSIHRVLAAGLRKKAQQHSRRAVIYASENHNHAAEILQSRVFELIPPEEREAVHAHVRFLNTVIGKMSGVISDPQEVRELGLTPITESQTRAFLVEAFNRILISRICFDNNPFQRGISVFEEKADLLPFEEAKLYGHNATHALAAYVGALRGVRRIADLVHLPDMISFLEAAFIQESGAMLIRRHAGIDPLFTADGYREYALDLIKRMTNPGLADTVERVGRDTARKLGWDDRFVGTIRLALQQGIQPRRYAFGAAAALAALDRSMIEDGAPAFGIMDALWKDASPDGQERAEVLKLIEESRALLRHWRDSGFPHLETLFRFC